MHFSWEQQYHLIKGSQDCWIFGWWSSVKELSLDRNRLNDDDPLLISQALKRNTSLRTLTLHTNNLTSIGVKALVSCVFDSSSLNAISESNHTLTRIPIFCGKTIVLPVVLKNCLSCKRIHYFDILQMYQWNWYRRCWHSLVNRLTSSISTNIWIYCILQCNGGMCQCSTPIIIVPSLIQRGKESTSMCKEEKKKRASVVYWK